MSRQSAAAKTDKVLGVEIPTSPDPAIVGPVSGSDTWQAWMDRFIVSTSVPSKEPEQFHPFQPLQLAEGNRNGGKREPVVVLPAFVTRRPRFLVMQKWEGAVLEVGAGSFWARLIDLTQPGPDEEAEFSIDEVPPADRHLLEPGAIFYWNIGYKDSPGGQRTRASDIRFRRLPRWSDAELSKANEGVARMRHLLERD